MCLELLNDRRFYDHLLAIDRELALHARRCGCPRCEGRLDSASYPRKPRGCASELGDIHHRRLSFCCAACRKRVTPPSVRFLGRRVFFGAVVVLGCVQTLTAERVSALCELLGVDRRTLRRWRRWWRCQLVHLPWWRVARARFSPALDVQRLPGSLLDRFTGTLEVQLAALLKFLSPLTTTSSPLS